MTHFRSSAARIAASLAAIFFFAASAAAQTPTLSINDLTIAEGNAGTKLANFTVSLSAAQAGPVFVDISTASGSASPGSDYLEKSTLGFRIAAGVTSKSFSVTINGDTAVEINELFLVNLSNPVGATLADGQGVGTISNDDGDAMPALSIADVAVAEGNSGTRTAVFTVSLSGPATADVMYSIATADGTATSQGLDYVARSLGGEVIPAGQTSRTFSVTINGDVAIEPSETFTVNVTGVGAANVADGSATGTITNDDSTLPTLSISDAATVEGNETSHTVNFWINLSAPSSSPVRFDVATANGTAKDASELYGDYTSMSGNFTIPANTTSYYVAVWVYGDTRYEGDDTFTVTLSNVTGATVVDGQAIGTITNEDSKPTLNIGGHTVTEGNSGQQAVEMNIALSQSSDFPVTYDFATADVSATAGQDYVALSGSGGIPAGETFGVVFVQVNGDTQAEIDETLALNLGNVVGATIAGQGSVTISNDDGEPPVSIIVGDGTLYEEHAGELPSWISVTLSKAAAVPVTFDIATVDGSAKAGLDYVAKSQSGVTIPAGQTSVWISLDGVNDTVPEPEETFTLIVSNASGAIIADGTSLLTVLDDDAGGAPVLSIGDVSIVEGNSGNKNMSFTVSLSAPAASVVSFDVATANATTNSSDFVSVSLAGLQIPAGQTEKEVVVSVLGDTSVEPDETFLVNVTNVVGAVLVDGQAVGTISNDDVAPIFLSIADVSAVEGSEIHPVEFWIALSRPSATPITFDLQTADGTAGSWGVTDFIGLSKEQFTIPANESGIFVSIWIVGDNLIESDESFQLLASNLVGATLDDGQATATILNDDSGPAISVDDVTVTEGDSGTRIATFTVSLSGPSASIVYYMASTADETTSANMDYVARSETFQFQPGVTSQSFDVTINSDTMLEANETFLVRLLNVSGNVTVADGQAIGTITDDDVANSPWLSIGDVSIAEGDSGTTNAYFTVSMSAAHPTNICFGMQTSGGGTATMWTDYNHSGLNGCILPGQTSKILEVQIKGDTAVEADETFTVSISDVVGANLADGEAVGTILNDDVAIGPTLSVSDVSIAEGNSGTKTASFIVSLSSAQSVPVYFDAATADQSATAGSDYVAKALAGQRIPVGSTSKAFTVSINGDTAGEVDEAFAVNLSNPVGATISDGQAVGTITNDDATATPTLSIADVSIAEGNSGTKTATFTVSLSPAASGTVSFNVATANGTATAGSDYVALSLSGQTIAAGATSKTVVVTINGDTTTEANETFTVNLTGVTGATLGDGSATGTITNDDGSTGPTLSIGDVSISEGNSLSKQATFTVTLSAPATSAVTYAIATANGTAVSGSDYTAKSMTGQSIAAGLSSKTFNVAIKGDTMVEPNETFFVNVTNVVGATVADAQATGTISNDDAATFSVARFVTDGLIDDVDDGNREPLLSRDEYALLLLDAAKKVCVRAAGATVVAVEGVEHRALLAELAEATNAICGDRRYQAAMADGQDTGFLVETTVPDEGRGVQVLGQPQTDSKTGVAMLQLQAAGHARPVTLWMPRSFSAVPATRRAQLRALGEGVRVALKSDPGIVLIGEVTIAGLTDLTQRSLPANAVLPGERILVSPAVLEAFGAASVAFPVLPANMVPAQVLQLR